MQAARLPRPHRPRCLMERFGRPVLAALLTVLAPALLAPGAHAQAPAAGVSRAPSMGGLPAGVSRGPSVGGVTEYNLSNGLKVLLLPDAAQDTVTVNVTYLVGSRHEGYGERGMAHLLEHMLFRGTARYANPKGELVRLGARYNGSTSF